MASAESLRKGAGRRGRIAVERQFSSRHLSTVTELVCLPAEYVLSAAECLSILLTLSWMFYADNRICGLSPFDLAVQRGELVKTSDSFGRSRKVRALKEIQVWAGIAEPRYPFRYRAETVHLVVGHIFRVHKLRWQGAGKVCQF